MTTDIDPKALEGGYRRLDARLIPILRGERMGCIEWSGYTIKTGSGRYGKISVGGRSMMVHRLAYQRTRGPIPDGLVIDHLCRNTVCCNPLHLEAVTHRTNILRGEGHTARNARKRYCKRGHPLFGENLRITVNGYRNCQKCRTLMQRVRKAIRARGDGASDADG